MNRFGRAGSTSATSTLTSTQVPLISKLLDLNYAHGVSDRVAPPHVVFHGGRIIDGHALQLHVVHSADPFAFHVVAYESASAQEDIVSFFVDDLQRLLPRHGSFNTTTPMTPCQMADLINVLCDHLAVGFKNGTFVLVERSPSSGRNVEEHGASGGGRVPMEQGEKVCLYRGNATISGNYVSVVVNELYQRGFIGAWSLEVLALSVVDEVEWSACFSVDQVSTLCPHFYAYTPHEAKGLALAHLVDANQVLLQPLLRTLEIDVHDQLVSSTIPRTSDATASVLSPPPASSFASPVIPSTPPSKAFRHHALTSIQGKLYYLTLRELWDGTALVQASLFDAYHDTLAVHTWREPDLLAVMHCAAVLGMPSQLSFQQGIELAVRPTLAHLVTASLNMTIQNQVELRFDLMARSLGPSAHLCRTSISMPDNSAEVDVVGPVKEADVHRTLTQITYPQAARGQRLRAGTFALVKVYCPPAAKAYVVKLMRLEAAASTDILVVYHRLPLEFVLALL
ncbi:hypothetical protein DYB37_002941 [Aphanomyces astaci]|uniref:Uncharacterized protein n=1 Tax=Aphanomyces astaci TaxID=112090 RepID=A0A418EY66_APHAT|nr:hypothetical protein DYB37_002941 [Aphanomyces astaci]